MLFQLAPLKSQSTYLNGGRGRRGVGVGVGVGVGLGVGGGGGGELRTLLRLCTEQLVE